MMAASVSSARSLVSASFEARSRRTQSGACDTAAVIAFTISSEPMVSIWCTRPIAARVSPFVVQSNDRNVGRCRLSGIGMRRREAANHSGVTSTSATRPNLRHRKPFFARPNADATCQNWNGGKVGRAGQSAFGKQGGGRGAMSAISAKRSRTGIAVVPPGVCKSNAGSTARILFALALADA